MLTSPGNSDKMNQAAYLLGVINRLVNTVFKSKQQGIYITILLFDRH